MKYVLSLFLVVFASPSYAYLDPGAGSYFFQSLVAVFSVVIVFFGRIKMIVKDIFYKLSSRIKKRN